MTIKFGYDETYYKLFVIYVVVVIVAAAVVVFAHKGVATTAAQLERHCASWCRGDGATAAAAVLVILFLNAVFKKVVCVSELVFQNDFLHQDY